MKVLKIIFFTLLGCIAIVLVAGLIIPKTFHAESSVVINKPVTEVFEFVRVLRNQSQFDAWSKKDPKIQQNYSGFDGKVGSSYTWKSDKVGDGKQVITKIDPNKEIAIDISFYEDDEPNKTVFTFDSLSKNETKVTWKIDGEMPYPWNVMSVFYDMNKDFEEGVQNLKIILEQQ